MVSAGSSAVEGKAVEEPATEGPAVERPSTKQTLVYDDKVTEEFLVEATADEQLSSAKTLDPGNTQVPAVADADADAAVQAEALLGSFHVTCPVAASSGIHQPCLTRTTSLSDASDSDHHENDSFIQEVTSSVAPALNQAAKPLEEARWRKFGRLCQIPHDAILRLVAEKLEDFTAVKVAGMKCGSFNCVYFIMCDNDETVLLRVPSVARQGLWHDEDAKMMVNDFRTTNFIGDTVDFGVPEMLSYDVSFENAIQAPHIFESCIPGKPLYQVQAEWKAQGTYKEKNARAMKQLGAALAQLCTPDLQFDEMGMLEFDDDDCSNPRIGPTYVESSLDHGYSMPVKRLSHEREIQERLYPLVTSRSFFSDSLIRNGHWVTEETGLKLAYQRITVMGLDLIPKSHLYPHEEEECFGLRHPDLGKQNILFDDEGNLEGIIDWSGTLAAPNFLSCASMPKFLVEDYTPWIPLPLDMQNGFEDVELAEQRAQFKASFTDNLVGQLGAGYIDKSPWFAAFERAVNDFEWVEGKPVGRRNFVDKLFARYPELNKSAILDYLANTGDEWPAYNQYYKETTGVDWPLEYMDVKALLTWMISLVFDCKERQVPWYYGIGYNGPLTADMESDLNGNLTREDAMEMLSRLKRNKVQSIEQLGGAENYNKYKNQLRHRVGRSDYLEHLARINNDQDVENGDGSRPAFQSTVSAPVHTAATPGPVGYAGRAANVGNAVNQTHVPLVGYQGRLAEGTKIEASVGKPDEGQMEKLRDGDNQSYREDLIAVYGATRGSMANLRSLQVCDLEPTLNKVNGRAMPEILAEPDMTMFEFEFNLTLPGLTRSNQDFLEDGPLLTNEHIRVRLQYLPIDHQQALEPAAFQHRAASRLQEFAPNGEVLIRNEGAVHLPSLVRSRQSSSTSSKESSGSKSMLIEAPTGWNNFDYVFSEAGKIVHVHTKNEGGRGDGDCCAHVTG
ncbi:hypothetical protein FKW77_009003 [Venturia effusa]|uniref:Aminoglycoside phosphotransferase domain-containing protein n=1 Tax=Venturia effusa TaxID=50376 RepID=A0A517L619_9PEZI|nr:hypothetical protein FKW77_009003 [Venturia effusa]